MKRYNEFRIVCIGLVIICVSVFLPSSYAQQGLSEATHLGSGDQMFQTYEDFQHRQGLEEHDILQREFADKNRKLTLLAEQRTPIHFIADQQEYREAEHLFLLEGNVKITKDSFTLEADSVQINDWTGDITASGEVFVTLDQDKINCEKLVYNFETNRGILYDCSGALSPSIFFQARSLERLANYKKTAQSQYYMEKGTVTACEGPIPDWKIKAGKTLARVNNYMHLNHPSFWIGKVPVLYMPYWIFPIKTNRASGFLIPGIAINKTYGLVLRNAYFWALSDSADLTFGIDLYSKIGWNQNLEGRYVLDTYSKGILTVQHVSESSSPRQDRQAEERWTGKLYQIQQLPYNLNATVNVNYISDQFFDADYGSEIEWLSNRNITSYASLTKNWTRAYMTADIDYTRDLDDNRHRDLQRLPRFSFSSGLQRIGRSYFRWIIDSTLESLTQEGIEESYHYVPDSMNPTGVIMVRDWFREQTTRFNVAPELRFYYNKIPWFSITPRVRYQLTWWNNRKWINPDFTTGTWATIPDETELTEKEQSFATTDKVGSGILRYLYTVGADWEGPKFYHIYDTKSGALLKLKHLIYPALSYTYIPEVEQRDILYYDQMDYVAPANGITYSLVNVFLGRVKIGEKSGTKDSDLYKTSKHDMASNEFDNLFPTDASEETMQTTARELARITLSQTYDAAKEGLFDEHELEYRLGRRTIGGVRDDYPYSDVRLETTVRPTEVMSFHNNLYFDPYETDLSRTDFDCSMYGKNRYLKLGWNYYRNTVDDKNDDMDVLSLEANTALTSSFRYEVTTYYDIARQFVNYLNSKITYSSQCWSMSFHVMYRNRINSGLYPDWNIDSIYEFGISVNLKNIGDVGFMNLGSIWMEN